MAVWRLTRAQREQNAFLSSLSSCALRTITLPAATGDPALYGCSFFVVVPGDDHQERQRPVGREVASVKIERILESLAAARIHLAALAPFRFGIIKAGPCCTYDNLVALLRHSAVEVLEIAAAPVAAIL